MTDDGERRYCMLRVQALNPAHPAVARGLAMLPDVPARHPLPAPAPAEPAPTVATPAPPPAPASPGRPQWPFWAAVGGLSLILSLLVGFIALRLVAGVAPEQTAAVAQALPPAACAGDARAPEPDGGPAGDGRAERDYTKAIELDPLYVDAYYNRGYAYRWYYDEPAKALADFEMATKLRPTWAAAHCELGNVRAHLGDPWGGLADTTRALELDPDYACAYYTRGHI